jgi:CheY-like chemotaxis protein
MQTRLISDAPHGRRLRILVAEDNSTNRRIVSSHLRNWGHEVHLSCDGEEAVAKFDCLPFDLILMDLQMPRLDGTAATRVIREHEKAKKLRRTPIIALTANVLKGIREECLEAGMDGYLGKPMREHELLRCIETIVPGLRRSDEQISQVAAPLPTPGTHSGLPFDVAALLSSVGGSKETVAALLADCRDEDLPELLNVMELAVTARDAKALARVAHAVKGVVGVFHAEAAHEAAKRLEASAKSEELGSFEGNAAELRRAVSEMLIGLESFIAGNATPPV